MKPMRSDDVPLSGLAKNVRGKPCRIDGVRGSDVVEIELENAKARISELGLGTELVRRGTVRRLEASLSAFLGHANIADLVALERTLEKREALKRPGGTATFVEAFLEVLGVDPSHLT